MLKVIGNVAVSYSLYDFLFTFHRNYGPILCHFENVENRKFFLAHVVNGAPNRGDCSGISSRTLAQKTLFPGYRAVLFDIFSCFNRTPASDGHTDRRTQGRSICRASAACVTR